MSRYEPGWADAALDQYVALSLEHQQLIDRRVSELLDHPDDADCYYDQDSDLWPTTDALGVGLIVYVFRIGRPRLVVLRLVSD
jgi:hypothetical protein